MIELNRVAIISGATPPQINGVAVMLQNMAASLGKMGWQVDLHVSDYSTIENTDKIHVVGYRSCDVWHYPGMRYPYSPIPRGGLRRHASAPVIVHVLTHGPFEIGVLNRIRRRNVRLVVSVLTDLEEMCNWVVKGPPIIKRAAGRLWSAFEYSSISSADAVHVLNESRAESFRNRRKRVFVIPLGVSTELVSRALAEPYDFHSGDDSRQRHVAFVGRLSKEKGLDRLLDLLEWDPWATAYVFGEGPARAELLDSASKRGVSSRLHLFGELPQQELFRHLSNMDALVFPSQTEEFGLAALEAAVLNVPVLSCAGLRGPEELARRLHPWVKLVDVWQKDTVLHVLESLGPKIPHRIALDDWSWERMAQQLVAMYEYLLGNEQGMAATMPNEYHAYPKDSDEGFSNPH